MLAREYKHIIIDTKARLEPEDLRQLVAGCHLLVLPCTPDTLSLDCLKAMASTLQYLGTSSYRVLLSIVPPHPIREGDDARHALLEAGYPLFEAQIPRRIAFQRAVAEGITVESDEYEQVAREIDALGLGL